MVTLMRIFLQLKPMLSSLGCKPRLNSSNHLLLKSRKNGPREMKEDRDRSREKPSTSNSKSNKTLCNKDGTSFTLIISLQVFCNNLSPTSQLMMNNMLKTSESSIRDSRLSKPELQRVSRICNRLKVFLTRRELLWIEKLKMSNSENISVT